MVVGLLGATLALPSAPVGAAVPVRGATDGCQLTLPAGPLDGSAVTVGGSLGPQAVAGWTLNYTYSVSYRSVDVSTGAISLGCAEAENRTTTGSHGGFSFTPTVPAYRCGVSANGTVCTTYLATFGPISLAPAGTPPAGYRVRVLGLVDDFTVDLVYQFAALETVPEGTTAVVSADAPTNVTATVLAADGTPSGLAVSFGWTLNGTGWSVDGPSDGSAIQVQAVAGAGVAELSLVARSVDRGVPLPALSAGLLLTAESTSVERGEANRTSVDVGSAVAIDLAAVGAPGYGYRSIVEPGLGLPPVSAPCSVGSPVGGIAPITCSTLLDYPSAGIAQPTATVTNGYSSGAWQFPQVTVSPRPALSVVPSPAEGYVGEPVNLALVVENGSGARPFAEGCLASGVGPPECQAGPGPGWTFAATYASPGNVSALAWAVDADGVNSSARFTIVIAPPLGVGPARVVQGNASVGVPLPLTASVRGGLLPLRYWWNVSGEPAPLATGTTNADGAVNASWVPALAGAVELTFTVCDHLGTVARTTLLVSVAPAPAVSIVALASPPTGAVVAGTAVPLSWAALDVGGSVDRAFAANAELLVVGASGPVDASVNTSAAGPLDDLGDGTFGVPGSAWIGGVLNVSLTVRTSTTVELALVGSALPESAPNLTVTIVPDREQLRLSEPTVARAGARSNATLWRVSDRFGNAVPGAPLTVVLDFGGERSAQVVHATALAGGGSAVWINYTATSGSSGVVTVLDGAGDLLLGPLAVPAAGAAGPDAAVEAVAAGVPLGAVGLGALAVVRRRRRDRGAADGDRALRALAEGRARTVELVRAAGAVDLAGLEAAWEPPPAPPALADWLASLVADGTLGATVGPDGGARFCLAQDAPALRVTVDPEALDRSLRRRDEDLEDESGD